MDEVVGVGLAGGQGIRCRPLTLKANGYMRAKAVVRFLGRSIVEWILHDLRSQGLDDAVMITYGSESRMQVTGCIGDGDNYDMHICYSPISLEAENTGSGSAVLSNFDYYNLRSSQAFIFPTDSLFDFNFNEMLAQHRRNNAVVTVATAQYPAELIANRYGLIDHDQSGRIRGFLEKPSLDDIYARFGQKNSLTQQLPPLMTSAGFYLMDVDALRMIGRLPEMITMRQTQCDIGGNLLPWLVAHGYPVYSYQIDRMGDLGNIPSYLDTMQEVLHGKFTSTTPLLPRNREMPEGCFIDPTSYYMIDPISRMTLKEKIEAGMVQLRGPVRIGKYVQIAPGVTLSECNIDDECAIHEYASVTRSSVGEGSVVGSYSLLQDVVVGMAVRLHSTREQPISLMSHVAVGDEVVVYPGVWLSERVKVYPRIQIPTGVWLASPIEVQSDEQLQPSALAQLHITRRKSPIAVSA
ncbi:MAG: sugar phosphate nucleotidyltransferase [Armatimonadota bacterium]